MDTTTRYAGAEAMKTRDAKTVLQAFKKIYRRNKYLNLPTKAIEVDSGSEFKDKVAKYFKSKNIFIKIARTGRHQQVALAEYLNYILGKFLGIKMAKQEIKTKQANRVWVRHLRTVINIYNNFITKKISGKKGSKKVKDNNKSSKKKKKSDDGPICKGNSCKLIQTGTKVRVPLEEPRDLITGKKLHGKFRASDIRYERKIREVQTPLIIPHQPPLYKVSGINDAHYHKEELQVVKNNEVPSKIPKKNIKMKIKSKVKKYTIEKIISKKRIKNKIYYRVKWKGFKKTTFEPYSQLKKDVPALIKEFNRR